MEKATFVNRQTLEQLDWPWVLGQIRTYLKTAPARESCQDRLWQPDRESAWGILQEVQEVRHLFRHGTPFPLGAVPDIRPQQRLLEKEAVIQPSELLDMAAWMDTVDTARRFLVACRQKAPLLFRYAATAPALSHLVYDIRSAVDENGEMRDEASPELETLRRKARKLHNEIHEKLEACLRAREYQDLLQDHYYTIKEDRYVLPIKTQQRTFVDGIVLGSSGSGATLFMEPRDILELNNRHKLVLLETHKEIQRILLGICERIRQDAGALDQGHEFLTHLDLVFARALFSEAIHAETPTLSREEGIRLRGARHPILLLRKERVVANHIAIVPPTRTLLVTGPNAGGKTAVLKTVGLSALMVRAGLPVPAGPGSNMPFFDFIFSDIGDSQSLEEDRSTFSGHILRFTDFLRTGPSFSLALLDEILIGTNPDEGSALAQAVLEHLSDTGGFSLATTHFVALKALAARDPRIQNASLGYDPETFQPSYELNPGIPGSSHALQISRELGLPAPILDRARTLLDRSGAELEELLLEIQAERSRIRSERTRLEEARHHAERLEQELARKLSDLESREKEIRRAFREKLEVAFQEAIRDLRKWKKERARPADLSPAHALREITENRERLFAADSPFSIPPPDPPGDKVSNWSEIHCGDSVYLPELRTEARVLELPDRRGVLTVEAKGFRMQVAREDVYHARTGPRVIGGRKAGGPAPLRRPAGFQASGPPDPVPLERCDLRGSTVEETLDAVTQILDRGFRARVPRIVLIHGLGKGLLRDAVRGYLSRAPYACSFRPGQAREGGDGVTVVEFDPMSFPP
jgi:DNA mismatch repair protein MutS2